MPQITEAFEGKVEFVKATNPFGSTEKQEPEPRKDDFAAILRRRKKHHRKGK
jgi:hypothetical protein